tara:strand:+ start:183 stop:515 length:333 start_codon:yes stop_codon:yes gene_type:complete
MTAPSGRPDHIMDYLVTVREGGWYGFSDPKNQVYATLVVHDGGYKPTEKECTDGLAAMQAAWDLEHDSYKSKRRAEYPKFEMQFDQIYHEGIDAWKATIKTIKDKYPKPN